MRELAHLLSVMLVVPALALASLFVAIGHATSQPSFGAFLVAALESIAVLLPWICACVVLLVALAAMGFSARMRGAAAIGVGSVAVVSTAVIVWLDAGARWEHPGFHVPAAMSLAIAAWLAATDRSRLTQDRTAPPS